MMDKAQHIILIGGSAGSYNVIVEIIEALPQTFHAAVIVVVHRNPKFRTKIEETLSLKLKRPVAEARDKEDILENNIYFATPGYHLLIEPNQTFSLDISERVQFSRPSIDVLFESAADAYGQNCTAFLLSGANKDGAQGIKHIRSQGGTTYVQSPTDALISVMPESAIRLTDKVKVYNNEEIISYFRNLK